MRHHALCYRQSNEAPVITSFSQSMLSLKSNWWLTITGCSVWLQPCALLPVLHYTGVAAQAQTFRTDEPPRSVQLEALEQRFQLVRGRWGALLAAQLQRDILRAGVLQRCHAHPRHI